mmetsp:Transcript_124482/g.352390  ORF Transcript_124482/g.352390 Transcript_124482/m.352390 type:complete len:123 (+) Transcript_124482:901-1269(+)
MVESWLAAESWLPLSPPHHVAPPPQLLHADSDLPHRLLGSALAPSKQEPHTSLSPVDARQQNDLDEASGEEKAGAGDGEERAGGAGDGEEKAGGAGDCAAEPVSAASPASKVEPISPYLMLA